MLQLRLAVGTLSIHQPKTSGSRRFTTITTYIHHCELMAADRINQPIDRPEKEAVYVRSVIGGLIGLPMDTACKCSVPLETG